MVLRDEALATQTVREQLTPSYPHPTTHHNSAAIDLADRQFAPVVDSVLQAGEQTARR